MMIVSAREVRVQLTGEAGQKQILATLGPSASSAMRCSLRSAVRNQRVIRM